MPQLVDVRDEADQARCVAERVLEQRERGMALKSQAVLFRSSSHSAQLELELARRDIPFVKYGGLKFLEASHVKDVLSVLRWADNPRNRLAGFRAVRLVPGIGPATATRLLDAMDATPDVMPVMEAFKVPPAAEADWSAFLSVFRALRASAAEWPAELEWVTRWYEPHLAAPLRRCAGAPARPRPAAADRVDVSVARALSHRTGARPAGRDERRGRRAATGTTTT